MKALLKFLFFTHEKALMTKDKNALIQSNNWLKIIDGK
jgi:hypothetical protein